MTNLTKLSKLKKPMRFSLCTLVYNERQSKVKKLILISGGGPFALAPEDFSLFSLPASLLSCFKPLILKVFKEVRQLVLVID